MKTKKKEGGSKEQTILKLVIQLHRMFVFELDLNQDNAFELKEISRPIDSDKAKKKEGLHLMHRDLTKVMTYSRWQVASKYLV